MGEDYFTGVKKRDPYLFIKADDFFSQVDGPNSGVKRPESVSFKAEDQLLDNGQPNPATSRGRIFRFNDGTFLLVQFMRPKVWRLRFLPTSRKASDFSDYNSRTIIQPTLSSLVGLLDECEHLNWDVRLITDPQYYVLQSVKNPGTADEKIIVQIWIQRDPFKILVVRSLKSLSPAERLPQVQDKDLSASLNLGSSEGSTNAIIWQSKERPLYYQDNATVLAIEKNTTAGYIGFGEQGGRNLFKDKTFMNYFNYDNMRYKAVYNKGPSEEREPLYHSEPYWLEVDGLPGYKSKIATFVDNYSHVCVDLGKTDPQTLRIATRFNSFNTIFVAGDSVSEIITLYTSIVGRPRLKPRYVLGYHQGCYGYNTRKDVERVVDKYRQYDFPMDGMHIDVDMQDSYHTFTIDEREGHFPNPKEMFHGLRQKGIKCSTNITPFISRRPRQMPTEYSTYVDGEAKGYFVQDDRDIDPSAADVHNVRYMVYDNPGYLGIFNPNEVKTQYQPEDESNLVDIYNTKKPFHGGVFYGNYRGAPGVYPNVNNPEVRRWWGEQYKYLFDQGLEFVWQDMTQPCMAKEYGDMKSFPFRLKLDSDGWSGDPNGAVKKKAIEIWSLYSYNLHKATYRGLSRLPSRDGKRNFIIGRGSFVGSHRYAGLWTGDNSSDWEFLNISVAQVLALGLSGITIAGSDVGGFENSFDGQKWADPALMIRFYGAYCLLPWFRNHYNGKEGQKSFQEPWAYQEYFNNHKNEIRPEEHDLYQAVLPTCRYFVRLRYSLMQLMYDTMFENLLTGLPIARAMLITDETDRSLLTHKNRSYSRSQYMLRNDLLVAPVLLSPAFVKSTRKPEEWDVRKLYLPFPNGWYPMNLRPDEPLGQPLASRIKGGSHVSYYSPISNDPAQIPYTTPIYIREGAIIPKIEPRECVPDPSFRDRNDPANPITIHVYPGKDNRYDMFLDDGISRKSGPNHEFLFKEVNDKHLAEYKVDANDDDNEENTLWDADAKNEFTHVIIKHTTQKLVDHLENIQVDRTVQISSDWNKFTDVSTLYGKSYTVVLWHDADTVSSALDLSRIPKEYNAYHDNAVKATIITVPADEAHTEAGVILTVVNGSIKGRPVFPS